MNYPEIERILAMDKSLLESNIKSMQKQIKYFEDSVASGKYLDGKPIEAEAMKFYKRKLAEGKEHLRKLQQELGN